MLVVLWFEGQSQSWDLDIANVLQIKNWLARNEPEVWAKVGMAKCKYVVGRRDESKPAIALHPQLIASDLKDYDLLVIAEDVQGEAIFSAIAGAVAAAVVAAGASAAVAAVVGAVVAAIVMIGISYALGQVIQMLSPNQKVTGQNTVDAAIAQKNMLFNGVANIREQGGAVPLVFGDCLVGGVVVSVRVGTSEDFATSTQIPNMASAMGLTNQGKWLWLTKV